MEMPLSKLVLQYGLTLFRLPYRFQGNPHLLTGRTAALPTTEKSRTAPGTQYTGVLQYVTGSTSITAPLAYSPRILCRGAYTVGQRK